MAFLDDQVKFAHKAADQTYDAILGFFSEKEGPSAGAYTVAKVVSGLVLCAAVLVSVLLGVVFRIGTEIAALFLETLENARHTNQDALNTLIAASMSDLLSVEVDGADIPSGGDPAQQLARAQVIGGKLHDLLLQEFGGGGGPEGIDGAKAARAFTGFNINFSTSAAFLSIITEIESLGYFKEFREIGEQMASALGLGRLHRAALRPLVDNLITKPYNRTLSKQYRQDRMADQNLVDAFYGGMIDNVAVENDLAEKGYRDTDISNLLNLLRKKPSLQQAALLQRFGELGDLVTTAFLTQDGWDETAANQLKRTQVLQHVDALERQWAGELLTLAKHREIDIATFQSALDEMHLSPEEKTVYQNIATAHIANARKRLSFAQVTFLMEHAQVTSAYFQEWAAAEGYNDEDALLLEVIVSIKEADIEAKKKAADAKAAAKAAKDAAKNAGK